METYRTGWLMVVVLAATIGAWTLLSWSVAGTAGCFVTFAVVGGSIAMARSGGPRWRAAIAAGLAWGLVGVGIMGLATLTGALVLVLVLGLTACSPAAVVWGRRLWFWQRATPETGEPIATGFGSAPGVIEPPLPTAVSVAAEKSGVPPDLESLDDAAVCRAWRASFVALQQQMHFETRLRLVSRRQEYLDALERRNPSGFAAWMASGARAAGDPSKYILGAGSRERPDRRL